MAQTMTMGQAAGVAAAMAIKNEQFPHEISVPDLQDKLRVMGAKFGEILAKPDLTGL